MKKLLITFLLVSFSAWAGTPPPTATPPITIDSSMVIGCATCLTSDAPPAIAIGTTTITGGTTTRVLYDNAGVVGEYPITGTGNVVMSASPILSGTITGGTFSGTHTGGGSGLTGIGTASLGGIAGTPSATTFVRGDGTWGTPAGSGGTVTSIIASTGLTGGTITTTGTIAIGTTTVTAASYGSATASPTYTVNAQGQLTAAANVTITPAVGSITGLGTNVAAALANTLNAASGLVGFSGALGTPTSGVATNLTGIGTSSLGGITGSPSGTTFLSGNGTWGTPAGTGVSTFSGGTTGFTPNSATSGAVTLAGTLVVANGGTASTTVAGALATLFGFPLSSTTYPEGFITGTTTNASGTDPSITTPILQSIALGANAYANHDNESDSVYIGNYAGNLMAGIQGFYETGGFAAIGNGFGNVAIGAASMQNATAAGCTLGTGASGYSVSVGFHSGFQLHCGLQEVFVGENAGDMVVNGPANTIVGDDNLGCPDCNRVVSIGFNVGGYSGNWSSLSSGIAIGNGLMATTASTNSNFIAMGTDLNTDAPTSSSSHWINIEHGTISGTMANGGTNPSICMVGAPCRIGHLTSANFNSTADQSIVINPMTSGTPGYMPGASKYLITEIDVSNCSSNPTAAAGGFYTAASKGGTIIGAITTTYTNCVSSITRQRLTGVTNMDTNSLTAATLRLSLTTAKGSAVTGDVDIIGIPYN